ncbi:OmpA family protein [uncultured Azohydromonas sp.]|jgi:Outer membrane protein and related peptidoglycan-associated (lipo)proteins|uniref:OmpA family protein n=1 Tax=uncultured Azohydromonas sp. TaxID=487342 RepID=UPI002628F690|nr:OmpA family protein [uncultured Azohydromonas sp.]
MTKRITFAATVAVALAAAAALVAADPAGAQSVRLYGTDEAVDPKDVAAILAAPPANKPKFRTLRLLDDHSPARAAIAAAAKPAAEADALALPVRFGFNSAEIDPTARRQLDALAEGIRLLPADRAVRIEGHTDAIGSEDYNERLSQRRALAVQQYLVSRHGIAPQRLRAVGLGELAPLDGLDPEAPQNRRVQFRGE